MNETENIECEVIGNELTKKENLVSTDTVKIGIYGIFCKSSGKWYVGQSVDIDGRWSAYRALRCKGQRKLYNSFLKNGIDNFNFILIENCQEEKLNERENYWINFHNSIDNGYNIREAGSNGRHSKETKQKMSEASKGKPKSKEHIAKLPQNTKGHKMPDSLKDKISKALTGHKRSPETIERMRLAAKRRKPTKMNRDERNARRRFLALEKRMLAGAPL
jgi:group I intron endonuclease